MSIRLHMLGLPHTQTVVEEMTVCAFTMKLVKFCEMMQPPHYDVFLYSGEANEAPVTEHIPVFTDEQQRRWYGDHDPNLLPTVAVWDNTKPMWVEMNHRCIAEISQRIQPGDLILPLAGLAQKPVTDAFPGNRVAEWAAGYDGIYASHVCFESYAWMSYLYGRYFSTDSGGQGRFYDTVIPNFFRPSDFEVAYPKEDFLLFVGRFTQMKGPHIAAEIAKASGRHLVIAGSGVRHASEGVVVAEEGFKLEGDIEYVGVADVATRNELMAKAHAIIVPTLYIEPFGAVAVEAQLCGTPAITTDWGAFPETVEAGVGGFRFRTLLEGVRAVDACAALNPSAIKQNALARWSLEAIAPMYDRWLHHITDLDHEGWYTGIKELPTHQPRYVVPDEAPHLGGYIAGGDESTYCPQLWHQLIHEFNIQSMLDLGCGEGHALRFFRDHGVQVMGIDGVAQDDPDILQWDFTKGPIDIEEVAPEIDFIWCAEFVEHVEEQFEENYLPLFRLGKMIAITHADPGQPGHHHVNLRSASYWMKRLREHGLEFDLALTNAARELCMHNGNHFARSGLVFRPAVPA